MKIKIKYEYISVYSTLIQYSIARELSTAVNCSLVYGTLYGY